MAVGMNAARAICARVPSVLSVEKDELDSTVVMDVEAFARDLAAYSNHRDRSVSIAGRGWTNFIREVHPSLLQGKDRGTVGSALHRAGERPLKYGQTKVSAGVEGADLLVEYESKKAAFLRKQDARGDDAEDSIQEEPMNDEVDGDEWEEVEEDSDDNNDSNDESAPDLVLLKSDEAGEDAPVETDETVVNLSQMTPEEREELKQKVSSTRVFTAADFEKMRKLVEREGRAKRDPRETARRKRAAAKGQVFDELSDDDSEGDSDDDQVRVSGVVNVMDLMADSKRKRVSKAEKLEKIVAGRQKFEAKARAGGSTNTEKKRKKNFVMTQFSWATRQKGKGKATAKVANKRKQLAGSHEAKKRRRKM
jgi:protein SDA1